MKVTYLTTHGSVGQLVSAQELFDSGYRGKMLYWSGRPEERFNGGVWEFRSDRWRGLELKHIDSASWFGKPVLSKPLEEMAFEVVE